MNEHLEKSSEVFFRRLIIHSHKKGGVLMKNLLIILTSGFIFFTVFSTNVFADEKNNVNQLKKEFESQLLEQINNATGSERGALLIQYDKYSSLTESEQNKFVTYLSDEELVSEIMKEYSNPGSSELSHSITTEEEHINGETMNTNHISNDIAVVESMADKPSNYEEPKARLYQHRSARYSKYVTIFGIKVLEHTSTLDYTRTRHGGRITSILGSDHRVTRNFTLNRISYSGKIQRYANTYAYSNANTTVAIIWKGVWTYDHGKCQIRVDNKSNVTGYFK